MTFRDFIENTSMVNIDQSKQPLQHGECFVQYCTRVTLLRLQLGFLGPISKSPSCQSKADSLELIEPLKS